MPLVTQAQFATLHGVSRKTVTVWKTAGHLVMIDGKVDAERSDAALKAAGIGRFRVDADAGPVETATPVPPAPGTPQATVSVASDPEKELEQFIDRLLSGRYASKAEAQRVKENALAARRVLEFRRDAGRLIEVEAAEKVLFDSHRQARDSWLNWPTRIGPELAADLDLDADKVTEALNALVHIHLTELGEPDTGVFGKARPLTPSGGQGLVTATQNLGTGLGRR